MDHTYPYIASLTRELFLFYEMWSYEERIHHLADQMIAIDLDDGVKVNYAKFQDVLARIKIKRGAPI